MKAAPLQTRMRGQAVAAMLLVLALGGCTTPVPPHPPTTDALPTQSSSPPGGADRASTSSPEPLGPDGQDRSFHVLTITGELRQEPPYTGTQFAACGRPAGAFSGLESDARALHMVRDRTDFDRRDSWLVVGEDVEVVDDSSSCALSFLSAHEGPYAWAWRSTAIAVAPAGDGLAVGEAVLREGESRLVHVDEPFGSDHRHVGDVTFRYLGAWNTTGIVEWPSEADTRGDFGGFWRD